MSPTGRTNAQSVRRQREQARAGASASPPPMLPPPVPLQGRHAGRPPPAAAPGATNGICKPSSQGRAGGGGAGAGGSCNHPSLDRAGAGRRSAHTVWADSHPAAGAACAAHHSPGKWKEPSVSMGWHQGCATRIAGSLSSMLSCMQVWELASKRGCKGAYTCAFYR